MKLEDTTYQAQSSLSRYCRDGEITEIPGVRSERLPHYRRLVFNVVKDALNTAYPITRKYIDEKDWEGLQFRFFSGHACSHPQIWRMPEELIGYCKEYEGGLCNKYPALIDILRFDWQEVHLFMMPDIPMPTHREVKPEWNDIPVLEPEMQLLVLTYPVHIVHPSELKNSQPGQFVSLAWRNRDSGQVSFMDISIFFALVLDILSSSPCPLYEAGKKAALTVGISDEETWRQRLGEFVSKLHSRRLIFRS